MNKNLLLALIALATAAVTNADRLTILWDRIVGPGLPPKTENWTHKTTQKPAVFVEWLNRLSPSPDNVAAATSGPDLHVWYRGGDTGTQYDLKELPWRGDEHPDVNFFHQDGTIVPVGFVGNAFKYLVVTTQPHVK